MIIEKREPDWLDFRKAAAFLELRREMESGNICPLCRDEYERQVKTCVICESKYRDPTLPKTSKQHEPKIVELSDKRRAQRVGRQNPPIQAIKTLAEHGLVGGLRARQEKIRSAQMAQRATSSFGEILSMLQKLDQRKA